MNNGKNKNEKMKKEKLAKEFYQFLSRRFKHDNNIWDYIEELWIEFIKK